MKNVTDCICRFLASYLLGVVTSKESADSHLASSPSPGIGRVLDFSRGVFVVSHPSLPRLDPMRPPPVLLLSPSCPPLQTVFNPNVTARTPSLSPNLSVHFQVCGQNKPRAVFVVVHPSLPKGDSPYPLPRVQTIHELLLS